MNQQDCPKCQGSGKIPCEGCSGTGSDGSAKDGERMKKGWSACATCRGQGSVVCSRCGGDGLAK